MAQAVPQTYQTHRRYVPAFHFVTSGILLVNFIWSVVVIFRHFSPSAVMNALTAVALLLLFNYTRAFATGNQDRIIRLEMRLRLERLLPGDLRSRIGELTPRQLVGLRFASDAELPALTKKVLDEKILSGEQIKKLVKTWEGDYLRV
ncbi:MAG TPA: DUF6526 family protein [Candidatus Methylomirabilis sp.]